MTKPSIGETEYAQRRERLLRELDDAVAVVFAGSGEPPLHGMWQADAHFRYLTGIVDEAGACVLLDPKAEDPKRRAVLFFRPLNPELEAWDGYRETIGGELKARTGFATVMRTTMFPRVLTDVARRRGKLACVHPCSVYDAPVSQDLAAFRKVAERVPGVAILDRSSLLPGLRSIKSDAELALMKAAIAATATGFERATQVMRPGVTERELQHAIEQGFLDGGASGPAYNSIVGAGLNGTVLHYMANRAQTGEADLVVIDAGAQVGGYAADITRTYPVSGRFTREQRELYELVLRAQEAAIEAVKPGAWMWQVDAAAREVIEKAGHGDRYIHGIGHQLGMEVHDANPDGPLRAGMVVTIEPGVYLKDRAIGIRIEDDVLVTKSGRTVLSEAIPKTVESLEAAIRRAQSAPKGKAKR